MTGVAQIAIPLPYLCTVTLWLLKGEPLTLSDAGPSNGESLVSLEEQLAEHGLGVDDLELLLITHHRRDHSGRGSAIKERSGAAIAAHKGTARWGAAYRDRVKREHQLTLGLIAAHGVPDDVIAASEPFFEHIVGDRSNFETDRISPTTTRFAPAGERCAPSSAPATALRTRCSSTTRRATPSSGPPAGEHHVGSELMPTDLPRGGRCSSTWGTCARPTRCSSEPVTPAHRPTVDDHRQLIEERMAFHSSRLDLIAHHVPAGCSTAFEIAREL